MSHPSSDDEAERAPGGRCRDRAASKQPHHHPDHNPRAAAPTTSRRASGQVYNEATFFIRHRGKLAAGVMVVVAIIFFTFVVSSVRW